MKRIIGIILCLLVGGAGAAFAADDTRTVTSLDERWAAAEDAHDKAFLEQVMDDQFVATDENGKTVGKAQLIQEVLSEHSTYQQVITHDEVHLYTDTAVLVETDTLKDPKTGAIQGAPYKFTVVFVKRDDTWRAVAEQWVPIKKPA